MSKIVLDNVESGFNLQKINSNFQKIEDELNAKVLYRDNPAGEPNTVETDIDINGKDILNVGTIYIQDGIAVAGTDITLEFEAAAIASTQAVASAAEAAASAANAASSATSASTSASAASTSQSSASSSASSASSSASAAATSASSAATSATTATTQAGIATTQATNAATSATAANTAKVAAEAARDAALAAYDNFDDRYLGTKTSDPALDNDGNALIAGALYFSSTEGIMKLFNGTVWVAAYVPGVASSIAFTPSGTIAATNVQTAIDEVNTEAAHLAGAETFTGAKRGTITTLTDGATITPDFNVTNNFQVTLAGNRTLANPTNQTAGQSGIIRIVQDATGSRTLAYGSNWKFSNGAAPVLTTTANAVDILAYFVESSTRITARLIGDVK